MAGGRESGSSRDGRSVEPRRPAGVGRRGSAAGRRDAAAPARRFLWAVAGLTGLVIFVALAWRLAGDRLIAVALAPAGPFDPAAAPPAPDYGRPAAWIAHPALPQDPARWAPPGFRAAPKPAAALFFVAPTAYLARSGWNAPLDDGDTNARADRFVRDQASVFNGIAEVWAPRYRQASFGSFLKPGPDARAALDLAYGDVERAFRAFLAAQPAERPIILAGHSQGARHLLRLLGDERGALGGRLVAAYAVGWPVALPGDLAATALPACTPRTAACLASWQSFAADGDLDRVLQGLAAVRDLAGEQVGARTMLCTNPLTGGAAAAGAERNMGALVGDALVPRLAGARCGPRGLLLLEPTPEDIGQWVLPGGNFHVYDIGLFWANLRADAEARLAAFGEARAETRPAGR
jgi:hypothetical protein